MTIDIANPGASEAALKSALVDLGVPVQSELPIITEADYLYAIKDGASGKIAPGDVGGGGGGTVSPLPFFGNQTNAAWVRPGLTTFSTWLNETNSGGLEPKTATATDGADGLPIVIRAGLDNSNYCLTGRLKTIGSPPWTITCGLAMFSNIRAATWAVPIILYDTANDNVHAVYWGPNFISGKITVQVAEWDGTEPGSPTILGDHKTGFSIDDYFGWFRIVHDGTTISYYISPEGVLFEKIYEELAGAFLGTIDKVGFGLDRLDNEGASLAYKANNSILWSWVEN